MILKQDGSDCSLFLFIQRLMVLYDSGSTQPFTLSQVFNVKSHEDNHWLNLSSLLVQALIENVRVKKLQSKAEKFVAIKLRKHALTRLQLYTLHTLSRHRCGPVHSRCFKRIQIIFTRLIIGYFPVAQMCML